LADQPSSQLLQHSDNGGDYCDFFFLTTVRQQSYNKQSSIDDQPLQRPFSSLSLAKQSAPLIKNRGQMAPSLFQFFACI
jgi:hypothetical protein